MPARFGAAFVSRRDGKVFCLVTAVGSTPQITRDAIELLAKPVDFDALKEQLRQLPGAAE